MLQLVSQITIIKQRPNLFNLPNTFVGTQITPSIQNANYINPGTILYYVSQNKFALYGNDSQTQENIAQSSELNFQSFSANYEAGLPIGLVFNFVNNVEINSSFKNLTKTAKITFPRKMNFAGLNLFKKDKTKGMSPVFTRGDVIKIQLGYARPEEKKPILKELFRGYIVKIGLSTPLELECEDQMFFLKQIKVKYPDGQDGNSPAKIKLEDLLDRMFISNKYYLNTASNNGQSNFYFTDAIHPPNTVDYANIDTKIPIVTPNGLNTEPFTYSTGNEKSLAEVLHDLKKKLFIYSYFDEFGNLIIGLPFMDTTRIFDEKELFFEKQIIEYSNMKFQNSDDMAIKVVFASKRSVKINNKEATIYGVPSLGESSKWKSIDVSKSQNYVGDEIGDTINVNAVEDMSQEDCNKYADFILKANKYSGYMKGSKFTTFGEPAVYIGQKIKLTSNEFPEKNGIYEIVSIRRTFGTGGYRQEIEIGVEVPG